MTMPRTIDDADQNPLPPDYLDRPAQIQYLLAHLASAWISGVLPS